MPAVFIQNPRKAFNFAIRFPGLTEWLAQSVTVPEVEIEPVEHGDANSLVKTGGLAKFGMLMVEKISSATIQDYWVWDWMDAIQNAFNGSGALPSNYKRDCTILQFAPDRTTVLLEWYCVGVWPSKINGISLSRVESQNTVESIEFCVDRVLRGRAGDRSTNANIISTGIPTVGQANDQNNNSSPDQVVNDTGLFT